MITKTPLEIKHFGNGDYFVIIASYSHLLLLTEYAANGLVEAQRMKDLMSCVLGLVETLNLKISRCYLADYVKELY